MSTESLRPRIEQFKNQVPTNTEKRRKWTHQEDEAILFIMGKYQTTQWKLICQLIRSQFSIQGRTAKQCRQRWMNHLNPEVNKESWTPQQEKILFTTHRLIGNRWAQIARYLPGRTDNCIKNHYFSLMRKEKRRRKKAAKNRKKRLEQTETENVLNSGSQSSEVSVYGIDEIQPIACQEGGDFVQDFQGVYDA